jgi:tetratricopeptide (TPR) repeat protein
VWDAPRKLAIAGAFRATGLPYAESAWGKVEQVLDAYASSWVASAEQTCIATRVRREQSEATFELRTACLEERLDALHALTDVLVAADRKTVQAVGSAAYQLPPLEPCSNPDRLSEGARWPAEPVARVEVRALQGEVAAAKALRDAGKSQQAVDRLLGIRQRVERAGYGPLLVSWRLRKGDAEVPSDARAAADDLEQAVVLADSFRLDEPKAEACLLLATLNTGWQARKDEARRWANLAGAAIARLGGDARLEIRLDKANAWIRADVDLFRHVLDRARDVGLDDPFLRADAHGGIGDALLNDGRTDDAIDEYRKAVREIEEGCGAGHPRVTIYLSALAEAQVPAGRLEDALESASRALSVLEANAQRGETAAASNGRGYAEGQMGLVLLRLGRAREALDHLSRGRDVFRTIGIPHSDMTLVIDVDMAEAQRLLGNLADAERALDEAEVIVRELPDLKPVGIADAWAERAKVDLENGAIDVATSLAERALKVLVENRGAEVYRLADTRLTLARALAKRRETPERVRALAGQARDAFAQLHDSARAQDAAAFLAALR